MKKPVVLRIYKGDQLLGVKQFLQPQIVIGRQSDVQVALENESVSFLHASIDERGENADGPVYGVIDLGSEKGTLLNGQPVLDSNLNSGDVLNIGDYKIEFYIGVPKPKVAQPNDVAATPAAPAAPKSSAPAPVVPKPVNVEKPVVAKPETKAAPVIPTFPSLAPKTPVAPPAPVHTAPAPTPTPVPTPIVQKPVQGPEPVSPPSPAKPLSIHTPNAKPPVTRSGSNRIDVGSMATVGGGGGMNVQSPMRQPRVEPSGMPHKKHGRHGKTFARASKHKDVRDFVKPSKGTVVEILVAWGERVIATHHFSVAKTITIGSHPDNDIVLPIFSSQVRSVPIVKIDRQAFVIIGSDMHGVFIKGQNSTSFGDLIKQNRMSPAGNGHLLTLEQNEMAQVHVNEQISVLVRYVSDSPKPLVAPLFDLTASEFTGIVLALAMVATLWLYTFLYSPPKILDDENNQEPQRTALILVKPPTPPPLQKVEPTPPPPAPTPAPTPVATPPPKVVKVKPAETKEAPKVAVKKAEVAKASEGASASAAPNKNKTGPKTLTSPKQGGAIKTAKAEGSQMQSKSRDMSKAGAFSAFASGGAQDKLAGSTTGSGELAGAAASANGHSGSAVDRAGKGLGFEMKDTGQGGHGTALNGISGGVGTTGRGSGNSGYGTGGLGNHAGTKIVTGGSEEQIGVGIDKEAIRRVVMSNLRIIKSCYEQQLNRHPDLFGKLILSWDIGEQGRVVAVRVKSNELGNADVANCITEKLKTWRFPEPPTNQVVVVEAYPFFFSN